VRRGQRPARGFFDDCYPEGAQALNRCSINYYLQTRELIGKQMGIILDRAQEIYYAKPAFAGVKRLSDGNQA